MRSLSGAHKPHQRAASRNAHSDTTFSETVARFYAEYAFESVGLFRSRDDLAPPVAAGARRCRSRRSALRSVRAGPLHQITWRAAVRDRSHQAGLRTNRMEDRA